MSGGFDTNDCYKNYCVCIDVIKTLHMIVYDVVIMSVKLYEKYCMRVGVFAKWQGQDLAMIERLYCYGCKRDIVYALVLLY